MHGSQVDEEHNIPVTSLKSARYIPSRYDEECIIPTVIAESSYYENAQAANVLNDDVHQVTAPSCPPVHILYTLSIHITLFTYNSYIGDTYVHHLGLERRSYFGLGRG